MPGIVGIIGADSLEGKSSKIQQMAQSMMHEEFYTSGTYFSEELGIYAGWVNCIGSFADCMPVWNEKKDICLIFTGETYEDITEYDRLRSRGHEFDNEKANWLVHLYEEYDYKSFCEMNGVFSGLLVDLKKRKAVLFNDRYGLKRIYYHESPDGFYFASEAKALLKILTSLRQLNMTSLGEFFSCGCPLQNRTLFSGVSMLPGGSAWTFSQAHKAHKEFYFRPDVFENQTPLNDTEYYDKLKETWTRILPRYFRGNERIGMSLTGGVDGRMIMAWARRPPKSMPCYTFGGMFRDSVDVKISRQVAKACQQPYQIISIGSDFISQFPSLAEKTVYVTDGSMDVSASTDLFANRIAKEIAPVRLTGNYGQEILRSAVAFGPKLLLEKLFKPEFMSLVRLGSQTYHKELTWPRLSFIAFKQMPWHHFSRLCLESSQLTIRSPYLDKDLLALAFKSPINLGTTNALALRLIVDGNLTLGKIPTDRGLLYKPIPLVTRLRHLYQELTFRAEYAYDYGMPQWLAMIDHRLETLHLEKLFLGRHKFFHFRLWYRDELSQYIKQILLDPRTLDRPYINARCLEEVVNNHIKGYRNYTYEIHRLLTLELLQRKLIEMA